MILKASQRGGAKQLGAHLLKTTENEHVEVHEVRGFMAADLMGALREAEAISRGTRCRQPLFSVSLNPPQHESVRVEVFEKALEAIEERNGLGGQPRVVVFHEKEGRRHCHAVWSRIDPETMTARPLPFFKTKLREVSKELYLENGWQMPRGLMDSKERDPRNFTLAEWQQAKRAGLDARELKSAIQECWAVSDNRQSFTKALEERGLYLARGDRRAHVAMTYQGEVVSIARMIGKRTKEVSARLGDADELRSLEETRMRVATEIAPRLKGYMAEAKAAARKDLAPLEQERQSMAATHQYERHVLDDGQRRRQEAELRQRAKRYRKGLAGVWDKLRGEHARLRKQNEMEAYFALQRDREQRHALVQAQIKDRQELQTRIRSARQQHAERLRELHTDAANYRLMQRGEAPKVRSAFEERAEQQPQRPHPAPTRTPTPQERLAAFREAAPKSLPRDTPSPQKPQPLSAQDRLERLRRGTRDPDREPDLER